MWDIIGHERAVSFLERSLAQGSLAHAYLIAGAPQTGKMALARRLAQGVNCTGEPPCLECVSCRRIESGAHADVQVIRLEPGGDPENPKAKTEIGVEYIKELQRQANLPPFEGKYKVFIIDGAEMFSMEAANQMLKTLEEPPESVKFILLTADERQVPATVVSRCQRIELAPVAASKIESALMGTVEPPKARLLARLSRGCPGWALQAARDGALLDERARRLERLFEAIDGDYEKRFELAGELAAGFSRDRGAVYDILELWLAWWRDLLLVKSGAAAAITNTDYETALMRQAQGFSLAQVKSVIERIIQTAENLKLNANARLALEVLMLHIPKKEERVEANLAAR